MARLMQPEILKVLEELAHTPVAPENEMELEKDLGIDSLGFAQLISAIEEQGIQISDPLAIKTVGDVISIVERSTEDATREPSGWAERLRADGPAKLEDIFPATWTPSQRVFTGGVRFLFNAAFGIVHRLEIHGLETLPADRPFLLCPNHQSYPDPLFLYARLARPQLERTLFVGWGGYFRKPPFSWLNRIGRVVPTGGPGRLPESLKLAYEGLRRGMIVCIFPEGGRTKVEGLMKPRLGAAILSQEAGVPIYPVRLEGVLGSLSWLNPGVHFCKIRMRVLDPIFPEPGARGGTMEDYQRLVQRWKSAIEGSD